MCCNKTYFLGFVLAIIGLLVACNGTQVIDSEIETAIPAFQTPAYNPQTDAGIALGRKLFYDPILSANNQISCATCHIQSIAFTDGTALRTSELSGNRLMRHTPGLANVAYMDQLFWDGGVPNLEFLAAVPIANPDEMGQNLILLVNELNGHILYPALFKRAFGVDSIEFSHVGNALAQFLRSLQSFGSKYDAWKRGEAELNAFEISGYNIYVENCASCHKEGLFTDNAFHNNGLDKQFTNDTLLGILQGRFRISFDAQDLGKFKTPTLRNLAFTAPYMHDGRFGDLNAVLEHYTKGIKNSETLAPELANGMELSKIEKMQLLAFLQTLNDFEFIKNEAFSAPE